MGGAGRGVVGRGGKPAWVRRGGPAQTVERYQGRTDDHAAQQKDRRDQQQHQDQPRQQQPEEETQGFPRPTNELFENSDRKQYHRAHERGRHEHAAPRRGARGDPGRDVGAAGHAEEAQPQHLRHDGRRVAGDRREGAGARRLAGAVAAHLRGPRRREPRVGGLLAAQQDAGLAHRQRHGHRLVPADAALRLRRARQAVPARAQRAHHRGALRSGAGERDARAVGGARAAGVHGLPGHVAQGGAHPGRGPQHVGQLAAHRDRGGQRRRAGQQLHQRARGRRAPQGAHPRARVRAAREAESVRPGRFHHRLPHRRFRHWPSHGQLRSKGEAVSASSVIAVYAVSCLCRPDRP